MPTTTEKYLREQVVKSAGHLKDIFSNTNLIRQDGLFNPYTAYTQMNTNQNDKQKDRIEDQQNIGIGGDRNVTNVG